jgi:hypothetical protein
VSTHGFLAGFRYKKNVTQKAAVEHEPLGSIPVPGVVPGVLAGHERVTVTAKPYRRIALQISSTWRWSVA